MFTWYVEMYGRIRTYGCPDEVILPEAFLFLSSSLPELRKQRTVRRRKRKKTLLTPSSFVDLCGAWRANQVSVFFVKREQTEKTGDSLEVKERKKVSPLFHLYFFLFILDRRVFIDRMDKRRKKRLHHDKKLESLYTTACTHIYMYYRHRYVRTHVCPYACVYRVERSQM